MSAGKLLRTVGEQIRSKRIDLDLTQRQLGERAGIVDKYVSEIERGTRDVPVSTLQAVVEKGLDLQLDIVFRRRDDSGRTVMPRIEDVWRDLATLTIEVQTRIVGIVRDIVELAR